MRVSRSATSSTGSMTISATGSGTNTVMHIQTNTAAMAARSTISVIANIQTGLPHPAQYMQQTTAPRPRMARS